MRSAARAVRAVHKHWRGRTPKAGGRVWMAWYGTKAQGDKGLGIVATRPPSFGRVTHRCRRVSAEDEPGAEFVGGVDFEAVFAR